MKRSDVGARAPSRQRCLSPSSYELLASRCNAFAVLSTTSCGSGLMEPPPSPFTFYTTEHTRLVWTGNRQKVRACAHARRYAVACLRTKTLSSTHACVATGTEPCSNEPDAPGEIRVLAPGWSPTASLATRAVYMRHAATLSSQRKSGHKSSDRERGQHAIPHPTTGEKQFYHSGLNGCGKPYPQELLQKTQ